MLRLGGQGRVGAQQRELLLQGLEGVFVGGGFEAKGVTGAELGGAGEVGGDDAGNEGVAAGGGVVGAEDDAAALREGIGGEGAGDLDGSLEHSFTT